MNISIAITLLSTIFQNTQVPYKPFDEFEISIDYQFKQRPPADANTIDYTESQADQERKEYGVGLRPYLLLNIMLKKLSTEEVKVHAVSNLGHSIYNKKIKNGDVLKFDMGFTDDVKAQLGIYEIKLVFSSREKKETSLIHLLVQENGTFVVNGETRGKF